MYINDLNAQQTIYVSAVAKENGSGTITAPFNSIKTAIKNIAALQEGEANIMLHAGKYDLDSTIYITPEVLKGHALIISAYNGEEVIISSAKTIKPAWRKWKDKMLMADIGKGLNIDQLYCNGDVLPMARYPNYDSTKQVYNGTAADAISKARVKTWSNPKGGYVHALHEGEWGSFDYSITGVDANGELQMEGGWQNNRPSPMNKEHRFVENIFEELDAPGEWYYNSTTGMLYYYPLTSVDKDKAVFEYAKLNEFFVISGNEKIPVKNVSINGIQFTQTNRTFMLTKEPLLRSDWTIYRGGAVLIEGGENISISNCTFNQLGGNAVFVSNYNRNVNIEGNEIKNIGGNAIAFVGNPDAVRSPSFQYKDFVALDKMDRTPGPKSNNYPAQCSAYNNLIHDIGTIEKQVAGVEISMAEDITVSHNTIYNVPRAGINIGDGCWGGDVIEYNDVFNTVLETGDHGAFNSWGRDRFWLPDIKKVDTMVQQNPGIPLWDVVKPIILRNNRFQCAHGWDIDLDDGSTNFQIYNNVCLNGGLKLREGFNRIVTNNIIINNSFHPHVWYEASNDVFKYNIVSREYAPIGMRVWGKEVDSNFFLTATALDNAKTNHTDVHSLYGNPLFVNTESGNYTVQKNSPALAIGFKNFDMDSFGVVSNTLKAKAANPAIPVIISLNENNAVKTMQWLGATVKSIETLAERSAAGLYEEKGVLIVKMGNGLAAKSGLKDGDVLLSVDNKAVENVNEFLRIMQLYKTRQQVKAGIVRNQKEEAIILLLK